MKIHSSPPSSSFSNPRVRVSLFPINPSQTHQSQFTPLSIFFFIFFTFFTLIDPTTTTSIPSPSRQIPYPNSCNDLVPESTPIGSNLIANFSLQFHNAYFSGGDTILGSKTPQSSVSFETLTLHQTQSKGVFKIEGLMTFWGSNFVGFSGNLTHRRLRLINYRAPRIPVSSRIHYTGFRLHGFWSEASGNLCMVGSGWNYLSSVNVVFKLHYPNVSTLNTSLITGMLESLDTNNSLDKFKPISIMGLSMMNYQYNLVDREIENGGFSVYDNVENASIGLESSLNSVCVAFRSADRFKLEYMNDCETVNCNPLDGGGRALPNFMSFNDIDCTGKWKARYLLDFSNSSYNGRHLPFDPNSMLVAEGVWNGKKKHFDLVACRIFNVMGSVAKASLGDCSIRLSLRLPAFLSLRNRSAVVGQMWSRKSVNDSGYYFGRLAFHSPSNGKARVEGLKYEYTEIDTVRTSCTKKMEDKRKGGTYPNGYSSDMRFDMTVKNSKGQVAWGYSSPLSVGDWLYKPHSVFAREAESAVQVNNSQRRVLNISYILSFTPPPNFKLGGELSSTKSVEISAEGVYDAKTGLLCMIGCRHLESLNKRFAKNRSLDCEILISIQYPPLNAKDGVHVKGTIESNRTKSDSLYFEQLELSASSIFTSQAIDTIWRMDLEITVVLISNTLACIFVVLQLFYVKKYPDMLPFISVVMLTVLTLAHMIPLVLNFEALFLANRNRQNVFLGSGGWLEVNEVLVRFITMIAFLLQFHLLQQTWSARVSDERSKSLWVSDKKVFYLSLPLYIAGGLVAWFVHQWFSYKTPLLQLRHFGYQQQSFWRDLKSYAGLILDGFLLPQVVFNMFCNSKEKALVPSFYVGTTIVRLLPHAYDLYRAHGSSTWYFGAIYANPRMDYYSTTWDIIISCSGLLFIVVIYLQQQFGGRCFLPKRFRESSVYEKVPIVSSE
ncbi:hypothetical protein LOK49_LG09G00692 [Camellia lanceoleosa]|uniref:Uncharacterized protein n=1 Tax=Camellia lanceoleosa TaxID=1840588 RepID=A0ACC0GH36_9ERIC|nr:hypothetical protein LOK49_LG09G00692 [Camellia lanceoleosa]